MAVATHQLWRCTGNTSTHQGREVTFNALPPGTDRHAASSAASAGTIRLSADNPELLQDFHAGEIYQLEPMTSASG